MGKWTEEHHKQTDAIVSLLSGALAGVVVKVSRIVVGGGTVGVFCHRERRRRNREPRLALLQKGGWREWGLIHRKTGSDARLDDARTLLSTRYPPSTCILLTDDDRSA